MSSCFFCQPSEEYDCQIGFIFRNLQGVKVKHFEVSSVKIKSYLGWIYWVSPPLPSMPVATRGMKHVDTSLVGDPNQHSSFATITGDNPSNI